MIAKFRIWDKIDKEIIHVDGIDFEQKTVRTADVVVPFAECVLMPSTGLFDKNGVEIFEGDVVTIDTDEFDKLIVTYREGAYWMCDGEFNVEVLSEYYEFLEVIGNIYENPELVSHA